MNERFVRAASIARVELAHEPDFVLGGIEVRPSLRELAGEGRQETIDPRVMQVLVALTRAKGRAVSRDDLIESCWDGVIVGDDAINRCINRLRKAGEASGNAFSIETIPRVGYRLKVTEPDSSVVVSDASAPLAPAPVSAPAGGSSPTASVRTMPPPTKARWSLRSNWPAAVAVLLAVGTVAGLSARALLRHGDAPAATDNSLAVLPFVNISGDPAREIVSDGISEELLDDLSDVSALRVAARTSSFAFKGKNTDIKQIARLLSVRSVLEGSVREDGQHVRISAQLINANDGFRIWSATYDRQMAGMLTLEDDIARAITAAITHRILRPRQEKTAGRPASINPDVYRRYLAGLHEMGPREEKGVTRAVALLTEVTIAQPDFAAGFAALGRALINHAEDHPEQKELLPEAEAALARALALDPDNIEALGAHADLALHKMDWRTAAADTKRMRAISPHSSAVLHEMFRYYQLLGFPDQALEAAQGAVLLDPLSVVDHLNVAAALIHVARFGEAAAAARAALDLRPDQAYIRAILCTAYAHSGEIEKSRMIAAQFANAHDDPDAEGCRFDIAVGQARPGEARRINDSFAAQYPNGSLRAVDLADNFAVIGDARSAVRWMEKAYDQKEFEMYEIRFDRAIPESVFADPDWNTLMQRPLFRDWQAAHDRLASELGAAG